MTPATLRKLEWAGEESGCSVCPACRAFRFGPYHGEPAGHAPDCELDAAIREAEQAKKGERPEIQVGDWVTDIEDPKPYLVRFPREVAELNGRLARFVGEVRRDPLWRQEPPTHD